MNVLVACEESQAVTIAMRNAGIEAYSCDTQPCSGGHPEWHLQQDVAPLLGDGWDMIIAFPPCTYLCRQAARWLDGNDKLENAAALFRKIKTANCDRIAIENPIPHAKAKVLMGDYTQIIHPWQFGHDYSKSTCLWLQGLPKLRPTHIVKVTYYTTPNGKRYTRGWYFTPRNSLARSKTFPGIAKAMAGQWGIDR